MTDQSVRDAALPTEAIENLRNHQRQLDMDGVIVGVSRQAIEEVLAYVEALKSQPAPSPLGLIPLDNDAKDGSEVLGYWAYSKTYDVVCFQNGEWTDGDSDCKPVSAPTHYMPLHFTDDEVSDVDRAKVMETF